MQKSGFKSAHAVLDVTMFGTWGSVVLTVAALFLAFWAGLRLARVAIRSRERRLGRLSVFFFLFALVQGLLAVETVLLVSGPPTRTLEENGLMQGLFWLRHVLFVLAIVAAVAALGWWRPGRRTQDGVPEQKAHFVFPVFLFAHPLLLVMEGVGIFYLVIRAADLHARRSDPGSLRVAFGFALLLVGHLSPFVVEPEGPSVFGIPGGGSAFFVFVGALVLLWSTWGGGRVVEDNGKE